MTYIGLCKFALFSGKNIIVLVKNKKKKFYFEIIYGPQAITLSNYCEN